MQETKGISPYKEKLKSKILDTAMAAFKQHGIRAVKMDDMVTQLGISKRTLYEIYENKEILHYECVVDEMRKREENLRQELVPCSNVMEILLTVYKKKVVEFKQTNPSFYSDIVKYPRVQRYLNQQNLRTRENMKIFFVRGVEEGFFRHDLNYDLTGRLFDALGRYVQENELYRQFTIEEIFNNLVFVTLRGLCTEKGIQAIDKML